VALEIAFLVLIVGLAVGAVLLVLRIARRSDT
jgi:hypothetical protein